MAGTKTGGKKASQTNQERHGEDFYQRIGARGGKAKNPKKGFGSNPDLASKYGSIGGKKSKRTKGGVR